MSVDQDRDAGTSRQPDGLNDAQASRRRLLRGGMAAAPVLLSVVSNPVLAGSSCTAASAFASLNASRTSSVTTCGGKTPSWWSTCSSTYWPSSYYWPSKLFKDCGFSSCTAFSSSTALIDVLKFTETSGPKMVAKHIVAALLNAKQGYTPSEVLNEAKVKTVWNEFAPKNSYVPTPGVTWLDVTPTVVVGKTPGGLTGWLQTTMS